MKKFWIITLGIVASWLTCLYNIGRLVAVNNRNPITEKAIKAAELDLDYHSSLALLFGLITIMLGVNLHRYVTNQIGQEETLDQALDLFNNHETKK